MSIVTASVWDDFVRQQPRAHILQLSAWGELKSAYGWQTERVVIQEGETIVAGAQLLFRHLPLHLGAMAYLPMGPYITAAPPLSACGEGAGGWGRATQLWQAIDATARRHNARFLKWEPGVYFETTPPDWTEFGFRPSPQTVQPRSTIVIDISGDEDAILKRMNQGTRRKIRQALKSGVRYYEGQRADVVKFTALMQVTGNRNQFGVHEPAYYERAYDLFVPNHAALILAEHEGDSLAGIMVFAVGEWAWYFYGASADAKRNLMATYGVQWQAIQWAKARGCMYYDLWGIPDADETRLEAQFQQRSDGLWGVYGFKRGWGGTVTRSAGAGDKVYHPLVYQAYRWALRGRE